MFPLVILEEWHKIDPFGDISVRGISILDNESSTELLNKLIQVSNFIINILKIKIVFGYLLNIHPKKICILLNYI